MEDEKRQQLFPPAPGLSADEQLEDRKTLLILPIGNSLSSAAEFFETEDGFIWFLHDICKSFHKHSHQK